MDYQAILTLAFAIAALTLKPGPGMMLVISHTISGGMKGCFSVLLGAQLVNLVFLAIVFAGFATLNVDMVFIFILVKALAAVYLIWMGIQGLRNTNIPIHMEDVEGQSFYDGMIASMILTASNPLVIVFYAGIFPTLLDINSLNMHDIVTIISVIVVVEAGLAASYCLPFALFRYKISQPLMQKMRIFSSVAIILIGLYIGYTALPSEDLTSVFG